MQTTGTEGEGKQEDGMHDSKEPEQLTDPETLGALPLDQVLEVLDATTGGLPAAEAAARLERCGYNEIPEAHTEPWKVAEKNSANPAIMPQPSTAKPAPPSSGRLGITEVNIRISTMSP